MRVMYYTDKYGSTILTPREFIVAAISQHHVEHLYYKEVFSYPQHMLVTFFTDDHVPYASVIADYKELEQCHFIHSKLPKS